MKLIKVCKFIKYKLLEKMTTITENGFLLKSIVTFESICYNRHINIFK